MVDFALNIRSELRYPKPAILENHLARGIQSKHSVSGGGAPVRDVGAKSLTNRGFRRAVPLNIEN